MKSQDPMIAHTFYSDIRQSEVCSSVHCFCSDYSFILLVDGSRCSQNTLVAFNFSISFLCPFGCLDSLTFLSTRCLFRLSKLVISLRHRRFLPRRWEVMYWSVSKPGFKFKVRWSMIILFSVCFVFPQVFFDGRHGGVWGENIWTSTVPLFVFFFGTPKVRQRQRTRPHNISWCFRLAAP